MFFCQKSVKILEGKADIKFGLLYSLLGVGYWYIFFVYFMKEASYEVLEFPG